MSVYRKLNEARQKFHELKLTKTGENKFAKYKYFELGDFLIPALKVFNDAGLCAVVSFDKETAVMTIRDLDKPDEAITITSPMGSADLKGCHEVQNIGAVETYQRRYLWVAALEIVEHDALDATTGNGDVVKSVKHKPTDETVDLPDARDTILRLAASLAIAKFKKGDQIGAYEEISGITDSDEKLRLWQLLEKESALRAFIKKHALELREKDTEPV